MKYVVKFYNNCEDEGKFSLSIMLLRKKWKSRLQQ